MRILFVAHLALLAEGSTPPKSRLRKLWRAVVSSRIARQPIHAIDRRDPASPRGGPCREWRQSWPYPARVFLDRPLWTDPIKSPIASARLTGQLSVARNTKSLPERSLTRTSLPANAARRKLGNLRVNSRVVTCMTDIYVSHYIKVKEWRPKLANPSAQETLTPFVILGQLSQLTFQRPVQTLIGVEFRAVAGQMMRRELLAVFNYCFS